jgi:hypothetical protein
VLLAGWYPGTPGYERRWSLVDRLTFWGRRDNGDNRFGVYGRGWEGPAARPFLSQDEEPPIYRAAKGAFSISRVNDVARYSSDRLFRIMASGGVPLVEVFPDPEGLGLEPGTNSLFWKGTESALVVGQEAMAGGPRFEAIRSRATADARMLHTWHVRSQELASIVEAVRGRR